MTKHLQELIEQARSGESERVQQLQRALQSSEVSAADLIGLLRSDAAVLRKTALTAVRNHRSPELLRTVAELVRDPDREVRICLAGVLRHWSEPKLGPALEKLLYDEDEEVRRLAVEAATGQTQFDWVLVGRLNQDRDWRVRQAIAAALAESEPRSALPALLAALGEEGDRDVAEACAHSMEKQLQRLGTYPADMPRPRFAVLEAAHVRLAGYRHGTYPILTAWLQQRVLHDVDLEQLAAFGSVLTPELEAGRVPRAHGVENICATVRALLTGTAPRAVVLMGDPGAGKTAVVHELAHQLRSDPAGPWHILRVTPSDILAGTTWLGEWQTKVKNLVHAIRAPRRVILYVPNLEELSEAGRSAQSESNVASALAPSIERGDIAILGESTPDAFRRGLGAVASLRRLFHPVEVPEAGLEQTKAILQLVRDEARAEIPESVLDRLIELAGFYLAGTAQPGRTVGLLRRVLSAKTGREGPINERDVLTTLSTATGIPVDFLDDGVPLDRGQVRAFFEARVMGQPEAVDAVVDLVTLVKAGLTDPGKPFGIMLFVGPTGVGKTELARALAEQLFGDPGRLIRLDMSEFATFEAHERLIGWGASRPGLLTASVRERPFSVVLLDEIEKAHPNVFDLCLQMFDAGRLTDQQGRTADFRRTIIILTSNIGSGVPLDAPLGFKTDKPALDREGMLREVQRWFRPEFLNRLDRIVQFRPLAEETAEKIARREVARVLERSGLKRRRLEVEVAPAVLALLLREGYSPAFGARPLKRTVERLVLLPVAQAIAAGAVPAGSLLRLVARNNQVEVVVASQETEADGTRPNRQETNQQTASLAERLHQLQVLIKQLRHEASPLAARKSEQLGRMSASDFWDNRDAVRSVQDEIYRLDGVLAALEHLERAVASESEATRSRHSERQLATAEERIATLENRARHVAMLVRCQDIRELGDAYVSLTLVSSRGAALDAVERLARMYDAFARRRGLDVQVLDDRQGGQPPEDSITMLVSGAGALALLAREAGLHQVSRGKAKGRSGKSRAIDRDLVRVDVLPVTEPGDEAEVRVEAQQLKAAQGRLLAKPRFDVQLLHVPTMTSVRAWTDGSKAQAVERLRPLLAARVQALRNASEQGAVIRRYVLGPAPLVRDLRSGRSTGRLERVLQGHIDLFLELPS